MLDLNLIVFKDQIDVFSDRTFGIFGARDTSTNIRDRLKSCTQ